VTLFTRITPKSSRYSRPPSRVDALWFARGQKLAADRSATAAEQSALAASQSADAAQETVRYQREDVERNRVVFVLQHVGNEAHV
jgi:hypothetical protein